STSLSLITICSRETLAPYELAVPVGPKANRSSSPISGPLIMWGVMVITILAAFSDCEGVEKTLPIMGIKPMAGMPDRPLVLSNLIIVAISTMLPYFMREVPLVRLVVKEGWNASGPAANPEDSSDIFICT